jgi:hypothetical protein
MVTLAGALNYGYQGLQAAGKYAIDFVTDPKVWDDALTGATVGGLYAWMNDEDPLSGALTGAAVGGIGGKILQETTRYDLTDWVFGTEGSNGLPINEGFSQEQNQAYMGDKFVPPKAGLANKVVNKASGSTIGSVALENAIPLGLTAMAQKADNKREEEQYQEALAQAAKEDRTAVFRGAGGGNVSRLNAGIRGSFTNKRTPLSTKQ